jgi:hypothetical protein
MVRILLVVTLVTVVTASRADICRWRDPEGRVHYSAFAPEGMECERTVRQSLQTAGTTTPTAQDYRQQEMEFRRRRIARMEADERAAQEKQERDRLNDACREARGRLAWLQSGGRVARIDASGERSFLDEAEVGREASTLRDRISQMCL